MNIVVKYCAYITLLFGTWGLSWGQVQISYQGSIVPSGSVNTFEIDYYDSLEFFSIDFKNISGVDKNYTVKRNRLINPQSWSNFKTSWELDLSLGFCYVGVPDSTWTTPQSILAQDNETVHLQDYYTLYNDSCMHYRYYLISAENGVEDSVDVIGCSVVGLDEAQEITISIYPNPADNLVHIESPEHIKSLKVFDNRGQVHCETVVNFNSIILSTDKLDAGMYFILLHTEGGTAVEHIRIFD